jgi:hypothetical protein
MTVAKLEIKVGAVSFTGEGAESWLAHQLDKVLAKLPELLNLHVENSDESLSDHKDLANPHIAPHGAVRKGTALAAFLREKKATGSQTRKFLAAALWLHDVKDQKRVATADVSKALNEHNQGKLTNPTQCLVSNATQGMVVRDGKQFYVTDEGRAELDK